MFIAGVLVMASATTLEIGATRSYAMRRPPQNVFSPRPSKTGLLFPQGNPNVLARQNKWQEHSLARPMFVSG
jgi:hypothetical protein